MDFALALDIIFWILIGYVFLCLLRLLKGPSVWDRLLGMNIVATKTVVIIIVYASINNTAFLLDFAVVYALSGFIGTIYIALFFADRRRRKRK